MIFSTEKCITDACRHSFTVHIFQKTIYHENMALGRTKATIEVTIKNSTSPLVWSNFFIFIRTSWTWLQQHQDILRLVTGRTCPSSMWPWKTLPKQLWEKCTVGAPTSYLASKHHPAGYLHFTQRDVQLNWSAAAVPILRSPLRWQVPSTAEPVCQS